MKHTVAITAVGVLNALGAGLRGVSDGLFAGDQGGIVYSADFLVESSCYVAPVRVSLPPCPLGFQDVWSRNAALSLAVLEQIRDQVTAAIERFGAERVGVVMGSSTSGIEEGENALRYRATSGILPEGYSYPRQQMGTVSEIVSKALGARGPSYCVSTACSSSAKVFKSACNLISSGLCDCVVVGGFDSLCKLTTNGFSALELVSDEVTNPFSKNRKGITIGEGGALLVLERHDEAQLDDTVVCIAGVGESSDAYHISSPDPEGRGAIAAIKAALAQARVEPNEIGYINLHGTGTPHNDSMEARAVSAVFSSDVPCSSTKPLVGHMLGASGATEVAFCWMVLSDSGNRLPPHIFDGALDPDLPALALVKPESLADRPIRYALSNSFGFGGSNCAVVLRRGTS
jgi:3-oxoacyl-[acyl-carrier-protein] synthase-1